MNMLFPSEGSAFCVSHEGSKGSGPWPEVFTTIVALEHDGSFSGFAAVPT